MEAKIAYMNKQTLFFMLYRAGSHTDKPPLHFLYRPRTKRHALFHPQFL